MSEGEVKPFASLKAESYRALCNRAALYLEEYGIDDAGIDAALLMEYVYGVDRRSFLLRGEEEADPDKFDEYSCLLYKRARRIPLQHLTGVQNFMGLDFEVSEDVLIPRQDTEILVEEVLKDNISSASVLDLCTGSGCILISLMHYASSVRGTGVDLSEAALRMAEKNASALCPECEDRLIWICADLYEGVDGKYDYIVSNPPYIASDVISDLMEEVRDHDPLMALDGGKDGLDFYRRIIEGAARHLNPEGKIYLEIGFDQGESVAALLEKAGFTDICVVKDYNGLDRVVKASCV